MIAIAAVPGPLLKAGAVLAAVLVAAMLLVAGRRARAAAMLGALVLCPVLLLGEVGRSSKLRVVSDHPLEVVVAALVALVVLAAAAVWLARHPHVFPMLAVLTLPFRIPLALSGTTSNLLVPLYVVLAAGALAWLGTALRGSPQVRYRSRREQAAARVARGGADDAGVAVDPPLVRWLARLLSLFVVLYAIQATYSPGFHVALQNTVFFYVPFAVLYQLLRELRWTPRLLRACLRVLVALALVFSAVGFVEYATRTILLNPKLVVTNSLHSYFTVNSLFYDPDIFGRVLALVMVLLAASLLSARGRRGLAWTVGALAVMWACLVLTLSRSSLGALLVGMAVLAALRWKPSRALVVAVVVIAIGGATVAITPTTFGFNQGLNGVSSGRGGLVKGGIALFGDRPFAGFGSGSFVTEYRAHNPGIITTLAASHTIPVTVAAEQGVIGLIAYVALVVCAIAVLVRRARGDPVRSAIAATFVALVFHTLLYADFLEDPATWALLGIGVALSLARRDRTADAKAPRGEKAIPSIT